MQGISVVIPFYCGNSYLETMAEQLKRNINNFKSDLKNVEVEVILVNDSPWSTIDESKLSAIKQSYKIVVNKKNSGIHQSRVNGINIASCDYILLLDQDDKISENYFESQYEKAMKENADLIIANVVRKIGDKKHPIFKNIRWHKDATTLAPYVAIGNVIASPGQCLIRKNAVPVFWLKNILSENCADDMYLWMLMLGEKKRIVINSEFLYTHVATGNNFSSDEKQTIRSERKVITLLVQSGLIEKKYLRYYKKRLDMREKFMFGIKSGILAKTYYCLCEIQKRMVLIYLRNTCKIK